MSTDPSLTTDHPDLAAIGKSLDRVLGSAHFKHALQLQRLLKYIVENTISGSDEALKERIIGLNVFDRRPDYETAEDPIVRSRVGQLRRRLERYYKSSDSEEDPVQIVILHGSYKASFVLRPHVDDGDHKHLEMSLHAAAVGSGGLDHPGLASIAPEPSRLRLWAIVVIVAACVPLVLLWLGFAEWRKSEFDLFWEPLLAAKRSVVIYTGTGSVYSPSASLKEKLLSSIPADEQSLPIEEWHLPSLAAGQTLTSNDLSLDEVDCSGSGEVRASANLAALLATHHRGFSLRLGRELPFEDLRGSPAILLGAYSNPWSMQMTKNLPFFFDRTQRIREAGGSKRVWGDNSPPATITGENYALVSRVFDRATGMTIISLAGTATCGTAAASDFVTDRVEMKKLAGIPRDALKHKNLQIVLHATLVDCAATSIDVVAFKYW